MTSPNIVSTTVTYSSPIVPSPYLRSVGWSQGDKGVFDSIDLGGSLGSHQYTLHRQFTIKSKSGLNFEHVDIFAREIPRVELQEYGQWNVLSTPINYPGNWSDFFKEDAFLDGISVEFDGRPSISKVRELELMINKNGLLGKVFALREGDRLVALATPSLIDRLDSTTDLSPEMRQAILSYYGLRENRIKVLPKLSISRN